MARSYSGMAISSFWRQPHLASRCATLPHQYLTGVLVLPCITQLGGRGVRRNGALY
jgi:hypothetical protein